MSLETLCFSMYSDISSRIMAEGSPNKRSASALANCNTLTEVALPADLVGIGPAAFDHCTALTAVAASGTVALAERPEDTPLPVTLDTAAEWAAALTDTYLYRYWFLR